MPKGPGPCFFYGTLMNGKILSAVIGRSSDALDIRPAILPDHTRLHVNSVEYPAVVPYDVGRTVMGRELSSEESCVRGTVVGGLSLDDISFLDDFEGRDYERRPCTFTLLSDKGEKVDETVPASVYLWTAPTTRLRPEIWSYDAFVVHNMRHWIGRSSHRRRPRVA